MPLPSPRCGEKDPIEANLKEVPWEDADVIHLAQDGLRC
jgi:hypothetical protein